MPVPKITILTTVTAVLISTVISAPLTDTPGSDGFIVFDENNGLPITGVNRVPAGGLPSLPFGNNPVQIIIDSLNSFGGLLTGFGGAGGTGLPGLGGGSGLPGLGGGTGLPGLGGIQIPFIGGAGGSGLPGVGGNNPIQVIIDGINSFGGALLPSGGGSGAPSIGNIGSIGSRSPSVVDIVYLK